MISKEELEKWAFQLNTDGDCDATDKDIETLITQALETMEELEKAKRCLPVDKEFEVRGSWIGSVQNYIAHLEESLENASVGNALLERENHHAEVVGHLVDLIIELKAKLSESSGNAFGGKRFEEAFTPDLSMSPEEFIQEFRKLASNSTPGSLYYHATGEWIPVSERMPDEDDHVLVSDGVGMEVSWIREGEWKKLRHIYSEDVTHWMPLPAGPKEQDNV